MSWYQEPVRENSNENGQLKRQENVEEPKLKHGTSTLTQLKSLLCMKNTRRNYASQLKQMRMPRGISRLT